MMSNMKKVSQYFIAFLWLWVGTAQADLTIQIDQSSDSALPVAILPFEWQGKTVTPPVNMSDVIGNDLLRSGKFRPVAESRLPARPKTLDEVDFAEWKQLGTDNLLIGQLKEDANGHYEIEMRFIDLLRKQQVIGKRWVNIPKSALRQVAHKMSDLIYEELTGIRGAFNTRIAYVTVKTVDGKNNSVWKWPIRTATILNRFYGQASQSCRRAGRRMESSWLMLPLKMVVRRLPFKVWMVKRVKSLPVIKALTARRTGHRTVSIWH